MSKSVFDLPRSTCPQCRYKLNSATNMHGGRKEPDEGCLSVCLNCGQLLIYGADLTLRRCSSSEIAELMKDRDVWRTIELAQDFIRKRGPFVMVVRK